MSAYITASDGRPVFLEDNALAELLQEGVIFPSEVEVTENGKTFYAIYMVVYANDVFGYACADAEVLPFEEIKNLYDLWKTQKHGAIKWLCMITGLKPIPHREADIKKDGEWDEIYENLKDWGKGQSWLETLKKKLKLA